MAFDLIDGSGWTRLTEEGAEITDCHFGHIPNTEYAPFIFVGSKPHRRAIINIIDTTKQT